MSTSVITACCGEATVFLAQLRREGAEIPPVPTVAFWAAQSVAPKLSRTDHARIASIAVEQMALGGS
jgi:hypothetical protein